MKHLKISLKLLVLLMAIGFMVAGCQKEDDNITEHITGKNTDNVNAKLINLDELKQVQALRPHLNAIERTFDIHKAKQNAHSKIIATDGSFTILTNEILQVTTSYSEAYTFRIETPSHPEAAFENFVIEKKNDQPYLFNIYSYVTLTLNGKTNHYIIATTPVDSDMINVANFQDLLDAKMQMIGNCLYEVDEVTGNAEPIWCFGTDGGGDGGDGGDGGVDYNSCGNWVYNNPNGTGSCIRTRACTDANGNITTTTEYDVTCPNGTYDGPDGSENGGDPNNGDIDDGPHWDDTDPIEPGGSGTGDTNNNPPPKGTLPFVPYDQQIVQCFGPQSDNDTATAIANWLDTASYLQIKNVATYLDHNECSEQAQDFATYAILVLSNDPNANPFLGADCRSFEYSFPPGALQRGCAVTDFNHTFYTVGVRPNGSPYYGEIDSIIPTIYFTAPNGITNGRAANLTAIAVTLAIRATDLYFAANPDASEYTVGNFFKNSLIAEMAAFGGSVSTTQAPFSIPNPAPYITSIVGIGDPYDCE